MRSKLSAHERLDLFLDYCESLSAHPFHKWLQGRQTISHTITLSREGSVKSEIEFDEYHLESYLMRLRQFASAREAFHVDAIEESLRDCLGLDNRLEEACQDLRIALSWTYDLHPVITLKTNGDLAVHGRTFLELLEAALYTGAAHSERLATSAANEASAGWRHPHPFAKGQLQFTLATWSVDFIRLLVSLRVAIFDRWNACGRGIRFALFETYRMRMEAASGESEPTDSRSAEKVRGPG